MNNQQNDGQDWKRGFNIAYMLMVIHQRAIIVPMRIAYGKEFFGLPCALALGLMVLWASFSRDLYMWFWIAIWMLFFVVRKQQTFRLLSQGARIYSQYDGWPSGAFKYCKSERVAKLVVEPITVGILGFVVLLIYKAEELPSLGLPYFLLFGVFSLFFVEMIKQTVWEKRLQGMQDARIEQEALMRESTERYGE